jgi:hypothetical protein
VIFGSEGTAQADYERMDEINKEIGLDTLLRGSSGHGNGVERNLHDEKRDVVEHGTKEHDL